MAGTLLGLLFEHYGVQLWMPEVGGQVDWHAEDHEETMVALELSSKRVLAAERAQLLRLAWDIPGCPERS